MVWTEEDNQRIDRLRKELTRNVRNCDNTAIRNAADYGIIIEKAHLEAPESGVKELTIADHKFLLGGQIDLFMSNCNCKRK